MTDRRLLRLARDFRRGLLGSRPSFRMCAVVCWPLAGYLSACGVHAEIENLAFESHPWSLGHTILRLDEGRILDPTADQFGLAEIYLGPMPALYEGWMQPAGEVAILDR